MASYKDIKYSVVATSFNDEKSILIYLNNIMEQSCLPEEIVIADGGSKDDTVKNILEFSKSCKVPVHIISGKRLNISEGYNEAIKKCACDVIGITGIGNSYDKDYFKLLCQEMAGMENDLVYSPIRGQDNNKFSHIYNETFLNGGSGQVLKIASNHGALVKKKVFEELGYFYEHFVYAGEDREFYLLALNRGYKTSCVQRACVYWETPYSFKEFLKQIKNYTIANMQIYKNFELIDMYKKAAFKLTVFVALIIMMIITLKSTISLCGLGILTAYFIYRKLKCGHKSLLLSITRLYMPLFYIIRFNEYLKYDYKVKR